jgi:hypothetical protein
MTVLHRSEPQLISGDWLMQAGAVHAKVPRREGQKP